MTVSVQDWQTRSHIELYHDRRLRLFGKNLDRPHAVHGCERAPARRTRTLLMRELRLLLHKLLFITEYLYFGYYQKLSARRAPTTR